MNLIGGIEYIFPLGKCDHLVLQLKIGEKRIEQVQTHRDRRRNCAKPNCNNLAKFYNEFDWYEALKAKDVQNKYDHFLRIYDERVEKYLPFNKITKKGRKEWYNGECEKANKKRDEAWERLRRKLNNRNREEYKLARNEYVRVRREEERKYEKDIVDKCINEPKLFYRYINQKIGNKETIAQLKHNKIYEDPREMSKVLNVNFQKVFTRESNFEPPQRESHETEMWKIKVGKELLKKLNNLDERKAIGPDEVSGRILKKIVDNK